MLKLGFIGAGTVGTALAVRLSEKGYRVVAVSSRSLNSARNLAQAVGGCSALDTNQGVADALQKLLDLSAADFFVPKYPAHQAALGCALVAQKRATNSGERAPSGVLTNEENTSANIDAAPLL